MDKRNKGRNPKKSMLIYYAIALIILVILNWILLPGLFNKQPKAVKYNQFIEMLENGQIKSIEIDETRIVFKLKDKNDNSIYYTGRMYDPDLTNRLLEAGVDFDLVPPKEISPIMNFILGWVIPIAIFLVGGRILSKQFFNSMGGQGALKFGKSNAKFMLRPKQE